MTKPNIQLNDSCEILLPLFSVYQKENKDTFIPLYSAAYVGLGIFKTPDHDKGKNCWFTKINFKSTLQTWGVLTFNQNS